jgi:L-seryl-tRNA(Ser) seleniumtransferase
VALTYLERTAHRLPFWDMATTSVEQLRARSEQLASGLDGVTPVACASVAGGGALPGVEIPSYGVRMAGDHSAALRRARPRPVVPVVRRDETVIDLRTVAPHDDPALRAALVDALT